MANQHTSEWTDEITERMLQLAKLHKLPQVTKILNKEFGTNLTYSAVRTRYVRVKDTWQPSVDPVEETEYREKIEIQSDGTQISDKLIEMTDKQMKDPEYILLAHGYDPKLWKIINVKISRWHYRDKTIKNPKISYATQLKVKPNETGLTEEELSEIITRDTKPLNIKPINYKIKDKRMLGIELMDMHFGINALEDYQDTIERLTRHLESRVWEKVVITFGSDLMHVDNLKNTTANGTRIQDVNVEQMIEEVKSFYEYLVTKASKQSNEVKVIYVKGNHDETTSGMLIHWLQARFRDVNNVEVDTAIEEVKVYTWESIFVALSHGDKGGKRTKNSLSHNYPLEWARAKIREYHKGHLHHEQAKDEFGIVERTLPTGGKTDQYHKDNSFDSAHRRFQIYEYSGEWLESIHYV